jgi:hypothetical protein
MSSCVCLFIVFPLYVGACADIHVYVKIHPYAASSLFRFRTRFQTRSQTPMCTCIHEEKEITIALQIKMCTDKFTYERIFVRRWIRIHKRSTTFIYIGRASKPYTCTYMYLYTQSAEERCTYMKICMHRCGKGERTRAKKI